MTSVTEEKIAQRIIPGTYRFGSVKLINQDGEVVDITALIGGFKVKESINMLFCTYEFYIIDSVVLLEKYGICGNEKIEVEIIKKKPKGKENDEVMIKKYLAVSSIENFSKASNNQVNNYVIMAICEEALVANIMRTSRSYKGTFTEIVSAMFAEITYKLKMTTVETNAEGNYTTVIPNLKYKDAFSLLLSRGQNNKGDVYYMFETLWDDINATSYSEMIAREPFDTFALTQNANPLDYEEQRLKIDSMSSNLGLSNYDAFKRGAFKSRTHTIDISNKTYVKTDFSLTKDAIPKIGKAHRATDTYTIAGKSFADIVEPINYIVNKNSLAYSDVNSENLNNRRDVSIGKRMSLLENQFSFSNVIKIPGDAILKCGEMLELDLPAAAHPDSVSEHNDQLIGGKYLITSITHVFDNAGSYTAQLGLKRDSFDRELIMQNYRNRSDKK